jgi:hypothetical protein
MCNRESTCLGRKTKTSGAVDVLRKLYPDPGKMQVQVPAGGRCVVCVCPDVRTLQLAVPVGGLWAGSWKLSLVIVVAEAVPSVDIITHCSAPEVPNELHHLASALLPTQLEGKSEASHQININYSYTFLSC